MAFSARFARSATRATPAPTSALKTATRQSKLTLPRQVFQQSRRGYASEASKSSSSPFIWAGVAAVAGGAGLYFWQQGNLTSSDSKGPFAPTYEDYQKVYKAVAKKLEDEDDYDDGSYGPVLVRLAWHASGTYDADTKTGGSNGATMRFAPESDHGANAGLKAARDFLEPIKQQFPWITYSDLWILAGVAGIQEMQGPTIPYRPGRADAEAVACTPDGRLPDASQEQNHLRKIFGRMGFNDQEIVALSGAHALGRCHADRSGFDGPWTFSPTVLTNDYYKLLLEEKWQFKKWNGPKQYEDAKTKSLMMLPTDLAIIKDKAMRPWVEKYAKDNDLFFKDFSNVVLKLFELGVPFKTEERWTFKPLNA